jgi:hypothetical protein
MSIPLTNVPSIAAIPTSPPVGQQQQATELDYFRAELLRQKIVFESELRRQREVFDDRVAGLEREARSRDDEIRGLHGSLAALGYRVDGIINNRVPTPRRTATPRSNSPGPEQPLVVEAHGSRSQSANKRTMTPERKRPLLYGKPSTAFIRSGTAPPPPSWH